MGMDIHMSIISPNGDIIEKDIFDGRNREWFDNMQRTGYCDEEYNSLPIMLYNFPDNAVEEINNRKKEDGYFGHRTIMVSDYRAWFERTKPHMDAGWVTRREKWLIDKGCGANIEPRWALSKEDVIEDMVFVEVEKEYDCSKWLYEHITSSEAIKDNDLIIYCFSW